MSLQPFHLAVPVNSLIAARQFYGELLGCTEGRSARDWVDFNFFGHQLVCHLIKATDKVVDFNNVDGKSVPVPHFGVVMDRDDWTELAEKLKRNNVRFIIEPGVRFVGEPGEQMTMFFADPSGNMLEFKAMRSPKKLFSK
ncbi:MAG: VOC family protein [Gammaproteobacteria bacterium]|nr:VOC family protein [Gammaproteobacteria bacterium]MCP4091676.1 VOC family protein [Gammaproteobacteria bacterium]MCP4276172.1 VOC family protein [Gammaproteobacteria bacterium]MCP4831806.1 VOC family protein [Gammaproteobacteria bacterium]MCP4929742.1 VOC family protein [Gammaproteobacteria bacterium]